MESGHNGRNQAIIFTTTAIMAWLPQWSPAITAGISATYHDLIHRLIWMPQWSPAITAGIRLTRVVGLLAYKVPQWSPAITAGISRPQLLPHHPHS